MKTIPKRGSTTLDPDWRETILLAVGLWGIVREEPERAGEVVRAMLQMKRDGEHIGLNVLLAEACLEDVGELGVGRAAAQDWALISLPTPLTRKSNIQFPL